MTQSYEVGVRLSADGSGLVTQTKAGADGLDKVAEATRKASEETKRATEVAMKAKEAEAAKRWEQSETKRQTEQNTETQKKSTAEAERFVQRLKEEAEALGKTKLQLEAYRAAQLALTEAQKASVEQSLKLIQAHEGSAKATQKASASWLDFVKGMAGYDVVTRAGSALVAYAKEATMLATRYETLGVVMPVVGRNAGITAREMEGTSQSVRAMGITMVESRESVIKMAQANIDLSLATKLARGAQDAAVIGNINSSEALSRLIYGIQSAQTDVLRTIGINVNFEDSYRRVAAQMKKTTEQLTEGEKAQIRATTVLEALTRITGTYEAAMGTAGKQMTSLARYAEDLKVLRGQIFNEALVIAVNAYTDSLKGAHDQSRKLAEDKVFKEWGREAIRTFAGIGDTIVGTWHIIATTVEQTGKVVLNTLAAIAKAQTFTPVGWLANKSAGDPVGKLSEFADSFGATADKNMQDRLNRRRFSDSAESYFDEQNRDGAAAAQRRLEYDRNTGAAALRRFENKLSGDGTSPSAPALDKKALSAYQSLYKQQIEHAAVLEAQLEGTEKLTASEQLRAKVLAGLEEGIRKLSPAQRENVLSVIEGNIAMEKEAVQREKSKKAKEEATRELERLTKAQSKEEEEQRKAIATTGDQNRKLAEQVAEIGLTAQEIGRLRTQRAEDALATAQQNEQMAMLDERFEGSIALMKARTREAQRFLDLTREGVAKTANVELTKTAKEEAKKLDDEFKRTSDNIERGLTDSIMRGFDKGKTFLQNFKDSAVNMFKTTILQPILQPLVRPVAQLMAGLVTTATTSVFGSPAAGGVGNALSLASGANSLSNLFSGGGALGAAGAGYSAVAGTVAAEGAMYAAAGTVAEGVGAGLMAGLSSMGPLGWAALGVGALLGADAMFGGGGGPKPSELHVLGGADGMLSLSPINVNGAGNADAGNPAYANAAAQLNLLPAATRQQLIGKSITTEPTDNAETLIQQLLASQRGIIEAGQAEAQAKAQAEVKDTQLALQRRQMEIALMESLGNASGALAERRKDELAALDASLRPMAEQIYAAQDLATARAAATIAEQQAAEAAARQAQVAEQLARDKRTLEIALMEAQGRTSEALAARRADELAAMDDSLRGIQEQIYAAQDLAVSAAAAAEAERARAEAAAEAERVRAEAAAAEAARVERLNAQRRQLEIELMVVQGDAAGALAARRADELAATDASLQALQRQIYAAQDLTSARKDEAAATLASANAATAAANAQKAFTASEGQLQAAVAGLSSKLGIDVLRDAQNDLGTSEYRPLGDRLSAARELLNSTYASASGGDLDAVTAFPAQLQSALSIARDAYASGPEFQQVFLDGNRKLNDLLQRQQGIQAELLRDVPMTIKQASVDQIKVLREGFQALLAEWQSLRAELRRSA